MRYQRKHNGDHVQELLEAIEKARKALNAYDPMREALQCALDYYAPLCIDDDENPNGHTQVIEKIREALAITEKGS